MSSVSQQRAALTELHNRLNPSNLKRALAGIRPSEAEFFIKMLGDAANTLARVPEPKKSNEEFHKW